VRLPPAEVADRRCRVREAEEGDDAIWIGCAPCRACVGLDDVERATVTGATDRKGCHTAEDHRPPTNTHPHPIDSHCFWLQGT